MAVSLQLWTKNVLSQCWAARSSSLSSFLGQILYKPFYSLIGDNKRTECHLYFAGTISALPQWTVLGKMPEYQISKNLYCTLSNIKAPTQLSRVILNNDILEDDTGLEWRQWLVGSNPGILMYCPATTQYVISQFLIWVSDLRRDLNVSWNCQPDMATQSDP